MVYVCWNEWNVCHFGHIFTVNALVWPENGIVDYGKQPGPGYWPPEKHMSVPSGVCIVFFILMETMLFLLSVCHLFCLVLGYFFFFSFEVFSWMFIILGGVHFWFPWIFKSCWSFQQTLLKEYLFRLKICDFKLYLNLEILRKFRLRKNET